MAMKWHWPRGIDVTGFWFQMMPKTNQLYGGEKLWNSSRQVSFNGKELVGLEKHHLITSPSTLSYSRPLCNISKLLCTSNRAA